MWSFAFICFLFSPSLLLISLGSQGGKFQVEEPLANGYKTLGKVERFCGSIFLKLLLSRNDS